MRDSPDAFASSYRAERRRHRSEWQNLIRDSLWVLALRGRRSLGIVQSVRDPSRPGACHLQSMWVVPDRRCRGIARAMVEDLVRREQRDGVHEFLLWVFETNRTAQAAYQRLGFRFTSEIQPFPKDPGRMEMRMRLCVDDLWRPS